MGGVIFAGICLMVGTTVAADVAADVEPDVEADVAPDVVADAVADAIVVRNEDGGPWKGGALG